MASTSSNPYDDMYETPSDSDTELELAPYSDSLNDEPAGHAELSSPKQDTRLSTLPSFPKNDAQVFEVAMVIFVRLHRRRMPHVVEAIMSTAEYWPAVDLSHDSKICGENSLSSNGDIRLGAMPRLFGRRLLKFQMRFCIDCTHEPHTPEVHAAAHSEDKAANAALTNVLANPPQGASMRDIGNNVIKVWKEATKNRPVGTPEFGFRHMDIDHEKPRHGPYPLTNVSNGGYCYVAIESTVEDGEALRAKGMDMTGDSWRGRDNYCTFLFMPDGLVQLTEAHSVRTAGWFDEAFYADGRNDNDPGRRVMNALEVLTQPERQMRSTLWLIRGDHCSDREWHAEAALYLEPRVDFDAMKVIHRDKRREDSQCDE